jgi:uncharacterized damage-inducible protein DinB
MEEQHFSLARCYQGWDSYQRHLVTAITPLSPEQLAWRAAPDLRSLGEQVSHIVAVRARWLSLDLREGGPELAALTGWDGWTLDPQRDRPVTPPSDAPALAQGLETTWRVLHGALERWTVADLLEVFPPTFPGEDGFTRQFVLWHLLEHDIHHGGELSFALGMHGLSGITI